jgi:hypothetical protein
MTKETRYLVQLIDIRGIEFTCLKDGCNARTTLDPSKLRDQRLGGQFKSGQLGSDQNRPTEVARNG